MTWLNAPSGKKADRLPVRAAEHNAILPSGDGTEEASETCTVITTLLDHQAAPADQVRDTYLTRWSASETTFGEDKTTITGAGNRTSGPVLRSGSPRLVIQEAWAWLTATQLVRASEAAALRGEARRRPRPAPEDRAPVTADEESFTAARHHVIRSMTSTQVTASSSLDALAAAADAAARAALHTLNIPGRQRHSHARAESTPEIPARHRDQDNRHRETPGHRIRTRLLLARGRTAARQGRRNRPATRDRGPWNRAPSPPRHAGTSHARASPGNRLQDTHGTPDRQHPRKPETPKVRGVETKAALDNPGSSSAGTPPGQLNPGQQITSGTQIASPDGKFVLQMQSDGNLVLRAPGNIPLGDTHTAGHDGTIAVMQTDGNFVLRAPGNIPVWASGTDGHPGTVLQVQDDGGVVLYAPGHQVLRVLFSAIPDPQNSVTTPTTPPATAPAVSPPTPVKHNYPASFNPQAAATWAVSNALVPLPVPENWKQLFTGDKEPCTTFVSWALAKGGMPEEADWFPYWDSPSTQHSVFLYMSSNTPVPAWYAANDFVSRFTGLGWATERQIYPGNTPTAISVGDVIYYQWDGTPNHPHLAIVTSIVDGQIKVTDQGGPTLYPSSRNRPMLIGHDKDDLTKPTKAHPNLKVFVIHWQ